MCNRSVAAIEIQEPRGASFGRRLLRDQVGGKIEVEVATSI